MRWLAGHRPRPSLLTAHRMHRPVVLDPRLRIPVVRVDDETWGPELDEHGAGAWRQLLVAQRRALGEAAPPTLRCAARGRPAGFPTLNPAPRPYT